METPFWLDLRKEYIDDNLDKLQKYLCDNSAKSEKDTFYNETIKLLRQRVEDLLTTISERPLYKEDCEQSTLRFNASLLATYLLADGDNPLALPAYIALMGELSLLSPRYASNLLEKAVSRLQHEDVKSLGFGWSDLLQVTTEVFAHNAAHQVSFGSPRQRPLVLNKYGTAFVNKNGLHLTAENQAGAKKLFTAGANSLDTGIGITLRTVSTQKLKQSDENDIDAIYEFTKDFIYQLCQVQEKVPSVTLKPYFIDDEVIVRVIQVDRDGTIHVETTDPTHDKLSGTIKFQMPSILYYYTNTIYQWIEPGDYLPATVSSVELPATFSIDKQLIDFFVEDNKRNIPDDHLFLAKLIDNANPGHQGWLNSLGIGMYTQRDNDYDQGDFAYLEVTSYGSGKQYGKINAEIVEIADESFYEQSARKDCIRSFAMQTPPPVYAKPEEDAAPLSPLVLSLLLRQLFVQHKTLLKPSERLRYLANANVMAEMIGDDLSASYIRFAETYLRALVQFVRKKDLSQIRLEPDEEYRHETSTLIRMGIIDILQEYGRKDNSERLATTIQYFQDKLPTVAHLARLVQTANSMQDIVPDAIQNIVHREIIHALSLETENEADLESDSGIYLGVESGTQEFKTSMVYPPNANMQPNETVQNHNIMKGICAFLNSTTGGTLFLGVNDQGYVVGLDNDMKFLHHQNIDTYIRYVQDNAKHAFGIDALPYLSIEPLYDDRVVAIRITPHPYRVVELNGVAYLRINNESRMMPEKVRQELIARKVFKDEGRAAAISHLQHACAIRKCAVLHNYASSNSGTVSNRHVEPYDVRPEDNLVICYDLDKNDTRVFNLSRIGHVEILEKESWRYTSSHKQVNVDVFHMTGDTAYQISLELDLMAKNLLVEEYPTAKDHVTPHRNDPDIWYLNTTVYQLSGIARFYIGLANHIRILQAPELKEYVTDFRNKYLQ